MNIIYKHPVSGMIPFNVHLIVGRYRMSNVVLGMYNTIDSNERKKKHSLINAHNNHECHTPKREQQQKKSHKIIELSEITGNALNRLPVFFFIVANILKNLYQKNVIKCDGFFFVLSQMTKTVQNEHSSPG